MHWRNYKWLVVLVMFFASSSNDLMGQYSPNINQYFSLDSVQHKSPLSIFEIYSFKIKTHRALFCKIEDDIFQKSNNLGLKFRLGNPDFVDYLETKPNADLRILQQ